MRRRGNRLYGGDGRLPLGLFMKTGHKTRVQEGYATQFIGYATDIPVPTVIDILNYRNEVFLITTALPGHDLNDDFRELSEAQWTRVGRQLGEHLSQLRQLPPPSSTVSGFGGFPLHCDRLSINLAPYGPFPSIAAFHTFIVKNSNLEVPPDKADEVYQCITKAHSRPHRLVLTHGDLHAANILVDDELNITGIVDWECCGWCPEYW